MHINDRIEEAKGIITGISDDAQKTLSMIQMSIPIGENVVKRIIERAEQAKNLFVPEEKRHGNS